MKSNESGVEFDDCNTLSSSVSCLFSEAIGLFTIILIPAIPNRVCNAQLLSAWITTNRTMDAPQDSDATEKVAEITRGEADIKEELCVAFAFSPFHFDMKWQYHTYTPLYFSSFILKFV
mgnify:CR=1 FL=1